MGLGPKRWEFEQTNFQKSLNSQTTCFSHASRLGSIVPDQNKRIISGAHAIN